MLGVLDRWTPTVNVLQTLIAQISFHIELCPLETGDSTSLYTTLLSICPSGFRLLFFFFFIFFCLKKANVPGDDQFGSHVRGWDNHKENKKHLTLLHIKSISFGQKICLKKLFPIMILGAIKA